MDRNLLIMFSWLLENDQEAHLEDPLLENDQEAHLEPPFLFFLDKVVNGSTCT